MLLRLGDALYCTPVRTAPVVLRPGPHRGRYPWSVDGPEPYEDWPPGTVHPEGPAPLRPRRRRGFGFALLVVLVVVGLVAGYALSHFVTAYVLGESNRLARVTLGNEDPHPEVRRPGGTTVTSTTIVRGPGWPPAPTIKRTERVLPAPAQPSTGGPHGFLRLQPDGLRPVAYDPCREIHFVTSGLSRAPLGAQQIISDALAHLTTLTGLAFVDDGLSDEAPSDDRPNYQPERYGERWAPVLIAWSDAAESPRLAEGAGDGHDTLGFAGSAAAGLTEPVLRDRNGSTTTTSTSLPGADPSRISNAEMIYVTGTVVLDGPDFTSLLATRDGQQLARAVVLHELGHLLGLDHVDDPAELMYPTLQPGVVDFGPGDRQGLFALGTGRCLPDV